MGSDDSNHEIQRVIETRSTNYETEEKSKTRDIQQAVSSAISDEAERSVRASGQDLTSENLDPTGKHYPFRILQPNKQVERVVVDWFMCRQIRSNIERVAAKFERNIAPDPRSHLLQWYLISTANMPHPGTMSQGMSPDNRTNIIVWIALGTLGADNGLLHEMKSGQDMSLDGHEKITFSGKSGGLAVLLLLSM
ncbi:hypothetical protein N7478_001425 [Penicillium angulare]|uniref:uncharacterized protein n=1 Tax=Penicillium angulare TaxID=116970 RepID=UPI00254225A6|nr:uncharacterized protein N7478_001425 [Penicillium angulare]KAJ5292174.1 hypothetical protein N7478_001425 [Penicillium angulare]